MGSVLERAIAESRSRSYGYLATAKAAAAGGGEGALLAHLGAMGGGTGALTKQSHMFHHAEQYRHFIGSVFTSIRPIAHAIAGQPIRVAKCAKKGKKSGTYVRKEVLPIHLKEFAANLEVIEQHPFLDAVKDPNTIECQWQLIYVLVVGLELTGKAYWWIYPEKDKKTKKWRKSIYSLPASWVTPKHRPGELYAYYELRVENAMEPVNVPSDQIMLIIYPDPANPLGSVSPLQAQARVVVADESIAEAQRRAFSNGTFFGNAIIIGRHPDVAGQKGQRPILTREQREQILTAYRRMYRDVRHMDEPVILDGMVEDIKPVTMKPRDMDFLKSMESTKRRIEQGHGVNPIINGEIQDANRASALAADDLFNWYTINPKISLLSQELTKQVRPMFDDDDGVVIYIEERKTVDPDQMRADFIAAYDRGVVSRNEWRQHLGVPPVHWGDAAYIPGTLVPVHVVREDEAEPSDDDLPGAEQREQDRQDKIESGRQQAQALQQQNSNKPDANGKPAAANGKKPPKNGQDGQKPDKEALRRMAEAFVRLRGIGGDARGTQAPNITIPVSVTVPAANGASRTVTTKHKRDPKTHLVVETERTTSET